MLSLLLQVLQACLAGRQQPLRLMQAGMAFAVWTFQHARTEAIVPHAASMLERLLALLDGAVTPAPRNCLALPGAVIKCSCGQSAQQHPRRAI